MSSIDRERMLEVALGTGRAASALLAKARLDDIRGKSNPRDLVTEWDLRSEALIREHLLTGAPDVPVVGEEGGGAGGRVRWLVDPIDGTVNFAHGLPVWAVSIALEEDDVPMVGVV